MQAGSRQFDSGQRAKSLLPAGLFSVLAHTALMLCLSLIFIGQGDTDTLPALQLSRSEMVAPEAMPEFRLDPPAPAEELVEPLEPSWELPEIPPPVIEPPVIEPPSAVESPNQPETLPVQASKINVATESLPVVPASVTAATIQQRVSAAGGKSGDVQFALAWQNINDVDLHVIDPNGEHISHLRKRSSSGGTLDVDMNVKGESTEPVENVRWLVNAPAGRYTVIVNLFRIHQPRGGGRTFGGSPFQLLARVGQDSTIQNATVSRGNQVAVFRFQYVPESVAPVQREEMLEQLAKLQVKEELVAAPMVDEAASIRSRRLREQALNEIIFSFPHTDAAIDAMRLLGGEIAKR